MFLLEELLVESQFSLCTLSTNLIITSLKPLLLSIIILLWRLLTHETTAIFIFTFSLNFRAATNCDMFVLSKTDLDIAVSYYPDIAEQIKKVARNRNNLVRERQIAAQAAAGGCASNATQTALGETEIEQGSLTHTMHGPSLHAEKHEDLGVNISEKCVLCTIAIYGLSVVNVVHT